MKHTIVLFYKYTHIDAPETLLKSQRAVCNSLGLKGRMIIAHEGINATLEGTEANIKKYCQQLLADKRFKNTHLKFSEGNGDAFPKLSIKVRNEIVAGRLGEEDINPKEVTGKYIMAEELHDWIHSKKEFYIIDMRNDVEQQSGYFEGSILPGMEYFADLPKVLPKLAHLKDKTVVTVCTGGVRCEKASGFLVKHGFKDVYQLYGGIVTYMEKYPGQDFKGSLYVFDNRLVMSFNMDDPNREIVGRCVVCQKPSENYVNCKDNFCHRHFICCSECLGENGEILCPMGCRDYKTNPKYAMHFAHE